jgi:hypothetical protein
MPDFDNLNEFAQWFHDQCVEMQKDLSAMREDIETIRKLAIATQIQCKHNGEDIDD